MTALMEKFNYNGWYVGIMDKATFAVREKETEEFGPYSKKTAIRTARFFNMNPKLYGHNASNLYAVAISGREALIWLAEKEGNHNK